jgi:VWFA-related protein
MTAREARWAGIALVAATPLMLTQEPPVFRSEVTSVYVDAFVSDGDGPLADLRAADFELKDNGIAQRLELVSAETRPVQAVLVFDTSSSLAGEKLAALRSAGAAFLEGLRPRDEAALVTFSEEIGWRAGMTVDKTRVMQALDGLQPEGATALFDALYATLALADPQGHTLVVLFSDGEDNSSLLDARQLQSLAERSNTLVHVVGLRTPFPPAPAQETEQVRALREIAEVTGGRYWTAESPRRLREAFAAIAASLHARYVLRYEPQGTARVGWHALSVRLRGRRGRVQARRGYWVFGP